MVDDNKNAVHLSWLNAWFFDKKIGFIEASKFCELSGYSIKTIYDWKYRKKKHRTPDDLFVKFKGELHLRWDVLRVWFLSQNPHLVGLDRR